MSKKRLTSELTQVNSLADTDYVIAIKVVNGFKETVKIPISNLKSVLGITGNNNGGGGNNNFLVPTVSNLSIAGTSDTALGSPLFGFIATFNWSTTNAVNIKPNSIRIIDIGGGAGGTDVVLADNIAATATSYTTTAPLPQIINNNTASKSFRIEITDTQNNVSSSIVTYRWLASIYTGETIIDPETSITNSIFQSLNRQLSTGVLGNTFVFPPVTTPSYKIVFVDIDLAQPTTFINTTTNFNVPMRPAFTLINGSRAYKGYRTQNKLSGNLSVRFN